MTDRGRSEFVNLFEKKTGNFNLKSRRNDKSVFLSFGYTTIEIPISEFKAILDFVSETQDELVDFSREDSSLFPLAERKTNHFNLTSFKDCEMLYLGFGHTMITITVKSFKVFSAFVRETYDKFRE